MPGEDGTQGCPRAGTLVLASEWHRARCEAPNLPLRGREIAGTGHRRGQGHPLLHGPPGHGASPHLTAPRLRQTQCERAQARTSSSRLATASAASRQVWKQLIPSMLSPREGMRSHATRPKPQPAQPGCRRPGTRWQRWEEGAKPPGMGTGSSMRPGCGPAAGGPRPGPPVPWDAAALCHIPPRGTSPRGRLAVGAGGRWPGQQSGSLGHGVQAAPSRCCPHLVLGQLDLAALQVEAQQRRALQLLGGAGQPLQQLLQLVLELPQAQQSRLQLVLSRQGWNRAHVWREQWQPRRRAQRPHGPTHRRVPCTQCLHGPTHPPGTTHPRGTP